MRLLTAISCLIFFSSCFELVEEWTMNSDGSGEWHVSLNASQSRTELDAVAALDSFRGYPVPNKNRMLSKLHDVINRFNQSDSVDASLVHVDSMLYMLELEVSFKSITALNRAIAELHGQDSVRTKIGLQPSAFFRQISVENTRPYQRISGIDFKKAIYTRICRFNQTIAVSSPEMKISPNKKACMYQMPVNTLTDHPEYLNFVINLNP